MNECRTCDVRQRQTSDSDNMKNLFLNKELRILVSTNAIILLAGAMLGPIYALFVKKIGGDLFDASLAGALFALTAGVVTFVAGRYSDRIKENELIIVLGYGIMGIGFLLYAIVNSIVFLFAVQVIIGLGEAIYSPAFNAIYSKHLDGRKSGRQWGFWESVNYFTTAIGAITGGIIVIKLGFTFMFIIMAMLCFGSAIFIYRLPRKVL